MHGMEYSRRRTNTLIKMRTISTGYQRIWNVDVMVVVVKAIISSSIVVDIENIMNVTRWATHFFWNILPR